mmetsp:Transcript_17879/g.28991  ORF Transcript_17879/g.28991 Transcript_17879/m.28991 type:complete len:89 (+) Transcript_17879:571-837(+)
MVNFKEDVVVVEYHLSDEERKFKKNAILHLRYMMQIRKNRKKERRLAKIRSVKYATGNLKVLPKRGLMPKKMLLWSNIPNRSISLVEV